MNSSVLEATHIAGATNQSFDRPIRVFVHLAHGQDRIEWEKRWRSGQLIGFNDPTPYGYARAATAGCEVEFSTKRHEATFGKVVRLGIRALLGFDYIHARNNREGIFAADIVWTHTEAQYLAVAALFSRHDTKAPKLLGQSVWLIDKWPRLLPPFRFLYRRLINRHVDLLTFLSPDNLAIAQRLFPGKRSELVLFGIPAESKYPIEPRRVDPIRVLAVGNDRHRDWETAVEALRNQDGIELTIVSGAAPADVAKGARNIRIVQAKSNAELARMFAEATLMLVPLKPNKHASGITVMQEAALSGVPIVASDVGGIRAYFDEAAVSYVPPSDAGAIREAVLRLAANPERALVQAGNAQARMGPGGLGLEDYIRRHVELSKELLPWTAAQDCL
jgi:glycosyltransferase involved in cell wall biosynthesis